jgi:hypothetical protein
LSFAAGLDPTGTLQKFADNAAVATAMMRGMTDTFWDSAKASGNALLGNDAFVESLSGMRDALGVARSELRHAKGATDDVSTASATAGEHVRALGSGFEVLTKAQQAAAKATAKWNEEIRAANVPYQKFLETTLLLAPAIQDNAASLNAHDLIAESNVHNVGEWAEAQRDANAELARSGMLLDFSAHTANNASQEIIEQTSHWSELGERVGDVAEHMRTAINGSFAQMLLGAKGFKEGFLDVWQSLKAGVMNILTEILSAFIDRFIGGLVNAIRGGSFSGAFQGMFDKIGSFFGGGSAPSGASGPGGRGSTGGGGMPSFGGVGLHMDVGQFALGAYDRISHKLKGGEEGIYVNQARDAFVSQWGSAHGLAARLTEVTGEHGGGMAFAALQNADSMAAFSQAMASIDRILSGTVPGGRANAALAGATELPSSALAATDAIRALTDALNGLATEAHESTDTLVGRLPSEPIAITAGGHGRVTRPGLFLAGEAGPEDVAFSGGGRSFGGRSVHIGAIHVTVPPYATEDEWIQRSVMKGVLRGIGGNVDGGFSEFEMLVDEATAGKAAPWAPLPR